MDFFKNLNIGQKINLITNSLMIFIVVGLSTYNYSSRKTEILKDLDQTMNADLSDFYNYIQLDLKKNGDNLSLGINLFKEHISRDGGIKVNGNEQLEYYALNQTTQAEFKVNVPAWYLDGAKVQENEKIIDRVVKAGVSSASIYQRVPEGFLLIASNIFDLNGQSIVGTLIPNSDEVAQTILAGNIFTGRVYVIYDWYRTCLTPIVINGRIEGMLSVGKPEKNLSDLKKIFSEKKFYGNGYPYLVSNNGVLLLHPTEEGKNIVQEESFKMIQASKQETGKITYSHTGDRKIQFYKKLNDIDAVLSVTVLEKDIYGGLRRLLIITVFITLLGIGLFVGINVYLSRSITTRIQKGIVFAQQLSDGDLKSQINIQQNDEIGQLSMVLNQMAAKLREIVLGIKESSNNIVLASEQMDTTSEDLSQGASEQASTVEEVSSTMEEMTAMIMASSQNAVDSEKITEKTKSSIENVVKEAIETIESTKLINSKIGIISDIAFQTNILALNAAVEAARAGEHGRGFAVVADEVRRLADETKKSAMEIISASKENLKKSEKTSQSLAELLPEIAKTTDMVKEIAQSSSQQSIGISQINDSLQQLNQVVQQNAASSEEMASGAEELSSLSAKLINLVSFFKV
jgi:methyl-accepting chemotaxis protein